MRPVNGPRQGLKPAGRQIEFLATKVVPPRGLGLIERPRLLNTVSKLPSKRLVVIKTPAGFGKTSLAIAWSGRLRQSGRRGTPLAHAHARDGPEAGSSTTRGDIPDLSPSGR